MKIAPPLPGFNYAKLPYSELTANLLGITGAESEIIGQSADGLNIYGFKVGDVANKPVIYIQGQLHGLHEWRTSYWVTQFMKYLINSEEVGARPELEHLRSRYAFYFVPCVNPDGYVTNQYKNGNGVNLNRNFDFMWEEGGGTSEPTSPHYKGPAPFSEPESQAVRDKIIELQPLGFVCNHSWGGLYGFTTVLTPSTQLRTFSESFFNETRGALGFPNNSFSRLTLPNESGLASNWAGTRPSKHGIETVAVTNEAGDQNSEFDQSVMGMAGLLQYCMALDRLFSHGNLA